MHAHRDIDEEDAPTYVPSQQPDGYPYGADAATKRAFLVSIAPPLTDAMRAHLRQLLMPRDAICPVCSQRVERDVTRGVVVAHCDRVGRACPMSGQPIAVECR